MRRGPTGEKVRSGVMKCKPESMNNAKTTWNKAAELARYLGFSIETTERTHPITFIIALLFSVKPVKPSKTYRNRNKSNRRLIEFSQL